MSASRIHWPEYRDKRKAALEFAPLVVEASEKEIQRLGGARSLWVGTANALEREVQGIVAEIGDKLSPLRLIVYLQGGDVALCSAELPYMIQDWAYRCRENAGSSWVQTSVYGSVDNPGVTNWTLSGKPWEEAKLLKVIRKHLPKGFDPIEARKEKDKFFKGFKVLAEPERAWDPAAFQELVQRFLAAVEGEAAPSADLGPGLAALEERVGASLPPELGALLKAVGPGAPLFAGAPLLDPAEALRAWAVWDDVYESMTLEDIQQHISSAKGYVYPAYTCPRWVPFLEHRQHYLCLDLVPGKKGNYGQVIAMGEDLDRRSVIAPSLWSWLELCIRRAAGEAVEVLPS